MNNTIDQAARVIANDLPEWIEGKPDRPCVVLGFSTRWERRNEKPTLYEFDGANYQHWTGLFDHAITHHIVIDLPTPPEGK